MMSKKYLSVEKKEYLVTKFNRGKEVKSERLFISEFQLVKELRAWYNQMEDLGWHPYYKYEPVAKVPHKPLTSLFVEKDKIRQINFLLKEIKLQYKLYPVDDVRRYRLKNFSIDMWNSLQNEFYMTANICNNSIWSWQDKFDSFHESGFFLVDRAPCELDDWALLIKSWPKREWGIEVLKLIRDFNLDNQKPEYVTVFMNDFKSVKNDQQFCSAVLKWSDLIYWSPWKLELYDNSFPQPVNSHFDDEFNPDYDNDNEEV